MEGEYILFVVVNNIMLRINSKSEASYEPRSSPIWSTHLSRYEEREEDFTLASENEETIKVISEHVEKYIG